MSFSSYFPKGRRHKKHLEPHGERKSWVKQNSFLRSTCRFKGGSFCHSRWRVFFESNSLLEDSNNENQFLVSKKLNKKPTKYRLLQSDLLITQMENPWKGHLNHPKRSLGRTWYDVSSFIFLQRFQHYIIFTFFTDFVKLRPFKTCPFFDHPPLKNRLPFNKFSLFGLQETSSKNRPTPKGWNRLLHSNGTKCIALRLRMLSLGWPQGFWRSFGWRFRRKNQQQQQQQQQPAQQLGETSNQKFIPLRKQRWHWKIPISIGNVSSNGGFSIVMIVFGSVTINTKHRKNYRISSLESTDDSEVLDAFESCWTIKLMPIYVRNPQVDTLTERW